MTDDRLFSVIGDWSYLGYLLHPLLVLQGHMPPGTVMSDIPQMDMHAKHPGETSQLLRQTEEVRYPSNPSVHDPVMLWRLHDSCSVNQEVGRGGDKKTPKA